MRVHFLCVVLVCLVALAPQEVSAQNEPRFTVELANFPEVINRGDTVEGKVRVTNLGARRGEFSVQTYVPTPFGPAALLTRSVLSIPPNETFPATWIVTTGELEPGQYEVRIGVKHKGDIVLVPLRFTVQ